MKKVRCIDALCSRHQLEINKIYEAKEGTTPMGTKYYTIKGTDGTRFMRSRFVDVVEEKYPQITKVGVWKVVFNPPYTIVSSTFSKATGKAKCNPKDEFDKWIGFQMAVERMKPCSK